MSKTLIVVGMGPGIGMAIARRFGSQGFQVAMLARDPDKLAGCKAELAASGISSGIYPSDASDPEGLAVAIQNAQSEMGVAGVLSYNAYAVHPGTPYRLKPADLIADFQVNVLGALASVQAVVPTMKEAGGGTILITGGGLALNPIAKFASLALGKAALRNLTFSMAQELEPAGIHVATLTIGGFVQPGTRFAPEKIAEIMFSLHAQQQGHWEREVILQ